MLGTIRDTFLSVHNELSNGVERLRINVAPSTSLQHRCIQEAVGEIIKSPAGSDLLLKFQTSLEEMQRMGDEGARLANFCSTRMGSAQQMCRERSEALMSIDDFLRNSNDIEERIANMNRQIDKLIRFCAQTEQAMTHLEALDAVSKSQEEINGIRNIGAAAKSLDPGSRTPESALTLAVLKPSDVAREGQEEVMLEEFLSSEHLHLP